LLKHITWCLWTLREGNRIISSQLAPKELDDFFCFKVKEAEEESVLLLNTETSSFVAAIGERELDGQTAAAGLSFVGWVPPLSFSACLLKRYSASLAAIVLPI
jgi:hypothetical protein